ncbi:propionate catabolism operon regulatory protein PrpR [Geomicrobium sp. JCM 19055]|nr:propionate catabolism operon regulatory protein PrpR [Geomicrobium sp. JCM 19055]
MTTTIRKAKQFAHTDSNILILGETGTGKELFAQSIHNESSRAAQPFIAVNCAAVSESLLESEFFLDIVRVHLRVQRKVGNWVILNKLITEHFF